MGHYEIIDLREKGEIILQNCWTIVDDSIFDKIRMGQSIDRTPPSIHIEKTKTRTNQT